MLLLTTHATPTEKVAPFFRSRLETPSPKDRTWAGAAELGLVWLARHQDRDGGWDSDGFTANCRQGRCGGAGSGHHDTHVTGLALLSFLGAGHTPLRGEHQWTVVKGLKWLLTVQTREGFFITPREGSGDRLGGAYRGPYHEMDSDKELRESYGHAVATLAVVEAYGMSKSPSLRRAAERGVAWIEAWRRRYPRRLWRSDQLTAWRVCTLLSAKEAGIAVPEESLEEVRGLLEEVTDPSGRVGHRSHHSELNNTPDRWGPVTAAGILMRVFLGEDPRWSGVIGRGSNLLLKTPPSRGEMNCTVNRGYWCFASLAMFQVGGETWKSWEKALKPAVLDSQRKDGDEKGSWDPAGPRGREAGRVYSTAMMTMIAETPRRYPRIFTGKTKTRTR